MKAAVKRAFERMRNRYDLKYLKGRCVFAENSGRTADVLCHFGRSLAESPDDQSFEIDLRTILHWTAPTKGCLTYASMLHMMFSMGSVRKTLRGLGRIQPVYDGIEQASRYLLAA